MANLGRRPTLDSVARVAALDGGNRDAHDAPAMTPLVAEWLAFLAERLAVEFIAEHTEGSAA